MSQENWRNNIHVLVPEAHAFGMIGVIRSLGRAGYKVHAIASNPDALGLKSAYAHKTLVTQPYDSEDFLTWLDGYITQNNIQYIVPSEGFLVATKPQKGKYAKYYPHVSDIDNVYMCMSKTDYLAKFVNSEDAKLRAHLPGTIVATPNDTYTKESFDNWKLPIYVKTDAVHGNSVGDDGEVIRCESTEEAMTAIQSLQPKYAFVLAQDFVAGVKATVNFLLVDGEVVADSMCVADHENPHTGGLTAYRRSWWNDEMYDDALLRMRALKWNGPVMVEYRWDWQTQSFNFLELNARYWAALNMDLLAGTDFPRIQLDHAAGKLDTSTVHRNKKIKCRNTIPPDYGYVVSSLKDSGLSFGQKLYRVVEFFMLGLNPLVKNDLWYPGDRGLYWRQWVNFIKNF